MSSSRKSMLQSKWLAVLVVVAAAYVNRDYLKSFFAEVADDVGELVMPDAAPNPAPGGAAVFAATFMPVVLESALEDPFTHDLETRIATAKRVEQPVKEAPVLDLDMPEVRLVLVGQGTRRALIQEATEGKKKSPPRIVAAGDTIAIGRIESVVETGIRVHTKSHGLVHVPLAARVRPEQRQNNADGAPGHPDAGNGEGSER